MRNTNRHHPAWVRIAADGAVAYVAGVYIAFPALLAARCLLRRRAVVDGDARPRTVSVVVAAHDEAGDIGAKLDDIAAQVVTGLDSPPHVIVASDGSTDRTVAVARAHPSQPYVLELPRVGKAAAMNQAVERALGDVVIFTDANSRLAPEILERLTAPFADPDVGGVAGDQRYGDLPSGTATSERRYWSYERLVKRLESCGGSVVSATGTLHAIRRGLIDAIPSDVTDDFFVSVGVVVHGKRLVFEPSAQAWEMPNERSSEEYYRRVRIITRGLTGVLRRRALLNPFRYGSYALVLLVHKVARRLVFLPLIVSAGASWPLRRRSRARRISFVAHAAFVAAAAIGLARPSSRLGRVPVVALPAHFCLANAAAAHAFVNLARSRTYVTWSPVRGNADARQA